MLKKLSNENSIQHKLLIWLGTHENEIFSQTDLARVLKMGRTTLNYHIIPLKNEGLIDGYLQLTESGRKIFFELWKVSGMPELRAHNTQIVFHLSKCPVEYVKRYKNKILQPITNKKYNGFKFKIGDFNCIFYSRKTVLCYVKNIFADTSIDILSALQKVANELKQLIEIEFGGVEIASYNMAKIQFGHIALTNSFLSKKLDLQGNIYNGNTIDIDHSLDLDETELTNFKKNNIKDIEVLKKIDKDFQEFMERDQQQQAEQEQQATE